MQTLILIVLILFPVSEVILRFLRHSDKSGFTTNDQRTNRVIWRSIGFGVTLAILASIFVPLQIGLPWNMHAGLVIGLMVLGMVVRAVAIVTLGRFFTVQVAVHEEHKLIDTGIYRYLRHPSYTGSMLEFLALAISFDNWLSLVVLLVPVFWAFLKRMRHEESVLQGQFGEIYLAYMRRTKRLVPGVW